MLVPSVKPEEKNWSPETAYQRAFYGKRAFAGKALRWMEHEARRRGVHIHQQMCGHGGEKVIAVYRVDGFCLETNGVPVPRVSLVWLS